MTVIFLKLFHLKPLFLYLLNFLFIDDSFCIITETYKQFLEENFDDKAYANSIIQGRAISESLAKLADGVSLLDKELHAQVNELP